MSPVNLSWSEAEVKDAKLSVPLEGEVPRGWKQGFERTVALLGSGEWGEVTLKKNKVLVSDVTPGSEPKLKHHLESIVTQANADVGDDDEDEESEDDEPADEEGDEDEQSDPDADMTERFRAD